MEPNKITYQQLSTMRPVNLLLHPGFWIFHQPQLLVSISGSIIMIIFIWGYIFPEGESIASLNVLSWLILLLMFVGIGWIAFAAAKVEIDDAYAMVLKLSTDELLGEIKAKGRESFLLDHVRKLLPENPSNLLSMPRLAEHVISNAEDRKFDSSMIIMQPYREEVLNDIFKINGLQRASLQLGIIGTFLGLIAAFIKMGDSGREIMDALPLIVDALKFSFSTSIAGLIASLSISMGVILILKRRQESYYRTMEESTDSLMALCRKSLNKDVFLNSFDTLRETVEQVYQGVEYQNDKLDQQTETISKGIHSLTNTKTEFEGFLIEISKTEAQFINEMKHIYEKLSPETTSAELRRSLDDAVKGISKSLQTNLEAAIKEYSVLNNNLMLMGKNLSELEKRVEQKTTASEHQRTEVQKGLYEYLQKLSTQQEQFVKQITGSHVINELIESVNHVGEEISRKQNNDLDRVIINMNRLENELTEYNKIFRQELREQSPWMAMKMLVTSIINLVRSSVLYVFSITRKLFMGS